MSNLNFTNLIKWHKLLHRFIYWIVLIIGGVANFTKAVVIDRNGFLLPFFLVVGFFYIATEMLSYLNYFDSSRVHGIYTITQILSYNILLSQLVEMPFVCTIGYVMIALLGIEYITYETDYDRTLIMVRKVFFCIPMMVNIGFIIGTKPERFWLISVLINLFLYVFVIFLVDWLVGQSAYYDKQKDELYKELGDLDDANIKLTEYKERMKNVNEQINYQKINLSRANRELEETNRDIVAQTEVLQYIVSSFDIPKCVSIMANSIVEMRKAKLCVIYLESNVCCDNQPLLVIKSDISILERRLKKDIITIYKDFVEKHKESVVYTKEDELKQFRFIGESNILSMAILPILDNNTPHGFMIVASNDERYFVHGTNKFDSDIIALRLALKNTGMYLDMQRMARHDGLTGVYNRLYFTELFAASCKQAARKLAPLSIALFDIDRFKKVNDTYGHLGGDEVLIAVAGTTKEFSNKYGGYCCRFGGEEFIVVLPGYNEEDALKAFEELHENIKELRIEVSDNIVSVNVCIGMTTYPTLCDNTKNMISRADKAMYYGKKRGRGRLTVDNANLDENIYRR